MDIEASGVEPVTITDILDLASWDRQRTNDELRTFISSRQAAIVDLDD